MAAEGEPTKPIRLFYSYSHRDEDLRRKLQDHLAVLKWNGMIAEWNDRDIEAGAEWEAEIDQHLSAADIILLLISASFIASPYCWSVEVKKALERHARGEARVIPVILRPCRWQSTPFARLQATPKDGKPVTVWPDPDAAFDEVVSKIESVVRELQRKRASSPASDSAKLSPKEQGAEPKAKPERPATQTAKPGANKPVELRDQPAATGQTVTRPPWASDSGQDRYGSWVEIRVLPITGNPVVQRLRWIPPGQFLMGAPETEPEDRRWEDKLVTRLLKGILVLGLGNESRQHEVGRESPQHEVRISRGFWLFDTACTQALWQAVMGNNPSRFQSPDRPVENVSWDDVQGFLTRINSLVPYLNLKLPTEAQWEYACRAGTVTPFSFGANITPEQVNYDGRHPYTGGEKGRYRGKTVPVASLPPNSWGLFEMHGNVLEWCADGKRAYYRAQLETDPQGPLQAGLGRVLRGGSWNSLARDVRSASRIAFDPGFRNDVIGFRCARVQEGREPGRMPEAEPRSGKPPEAAA